MWNSVEKYGVLWSTGGIPWSNVKYCGVLWSTV